ncbi:MAG: 2-amino-4-hydroxy-6-hydroxymethyldihydropteridine diphosphokinase [Bacteroidaceae bacterium]|nr:2-amino-4-hydroxy-6-hydroxymethyldihydropteridine diphosphokinase [Bacteroidaceae bacterium]
MLLIALGSNLGMREQNLWAAIRALEERVGRVLKCSQFYETCPIDFISPNTFINAAVAIETELDAWTILRLTQDIERELGRKQKSINGQHFDRVIDIDLLAYDDLCLTTPDLTLPHPKLHLRRFVLEPLCDIVPQSVHPILNVNYQTILDMLNQSVIIRETIVTPELVEALNRLLPQLSQRAKPLTHDALAELLLCPSTFLYTLRDEEGHIQATATLAIQQLLTGKKGWVEDVVVDQACRGRGYAKQILLHIEQEAIALGLKSLNLTSRPSREAANRLYQNVGYVQRETNVYRKDITSK